VAAAFVATSGAFAATTPSPQKQKADAPKAYVYTELQLSAPFKDVSWQKINRMIKGQPGFLNKTWLAGLGNNSGGAMLSIPSRTPRNSLPDSSPAKRKTSASHKPPGYLTPR